MKSPMRNEENICDKSVEYGADLIERNYNYFYWRELIAKANEPNLWYATFRANSINVLFVERLPDGRKKSLKGEHSIARCYPAQTMQK